MGKYHFNACLITMNIILTVGVLNVKKNNLEVTQGKSFCHPQLPTPFKIRAFCLSLPLQSSLRSFSLKQMITPFTVINIPLEPFDKF